ncbi:MAG: ATP-binding cassette domain-containing protein, partial [Firmicutes bacterium]|nr:ATP-binding cassette domain-containing protein [Bacillota bacterium]
MSASVERAEADARVDDVIIDVQELRKTYPGGIEAVKGISFQVMKGEVFGFLGPNGAGKSTTIMMLTTLLRPTGGTAVINGFDIAKAPYEVRMQLGYVSQDLAVDDNLTGRENLRLQAGFYHIPKDQVNARINEVLELVGLADRADHLVESYSGGMRKRLDIACGLIHRPRVLFLDEPTLGLDIQTRREIWRHIERLRRENSMTMFLTTHYMEEADTLCDRIAIIDRGVIKAIGSPGALKAQLGGDVIYIRFDEAHADRIGETVEALRALPEVKEIRARRDDMRDMHGVSDGAWDGGG